MHRRQIRSRQKASRFCRHLPPAQEPAWPAEDRAGLFAAGFPASALRTSGDSLGAVLVSGVEWCRRHPLPGEDQPKQGKDGKPENKPCRRPSPPVPPDQLDRFGAGSIRPRRRRLPSQTAMVRRKLSLSRPQRQAAGSARRTPIPRNRRTDPVQAATDAKMGARQKLTKRGKPGAESRRRWIAGQGRGCQGRRVEERDHKTVQDRCQERYRQRRGRQARGRQADRRGQVRDRQGRGAQRERWRRAPRAAP